MTLNCDLTHDLDPWFSRSNFEKVVTQQWDARLTWNERGVSRKDVRLTLWLWTFTSPITLTLNFQGHFLNSCISWEGRQHGMKGIWVDRMLLCDLELWLWPWILKVKYLKSSIIGIRGWIDIKGCESIGCRTQFLTLNFYLTHDLGLGFSRSNFW